LKGTKNALLPSIDAYVDLRNQGQAGSGITSSTLDPTTGQLINVNPNPYFVGGYGTVLGQLFGRNFPTYAAGFQLNIPLRNRQGQANMANALLSERQSELSLQKTINQVRVDVQTQLVAVKQARARYDAAIQSRDFRAQTLDAEQKKYQLGTSTPFLVIQAQRDLANAQQSVVQALTAYALARVQLDQAVGVTLETNHVEIDDAKNGKVRYAPTPIPDVEPATGVPNALIRR